MAGQHPSTVGLRDDTEAKRCFVAIAGLLAERGFGELRLSVGDQPERVLRARREDLPRLLLECRESGHAARLDAAGFRIEIHPGQVRWSGETVEDVLGIARAIDRAIG